MFYENLKLCSGPMYDPDFGRDPHIESIHDSRPESGSALEGLRININPFTIHRKYFKLQSFLRKLITNRLISQEREGFRGSTFIWLIMGIYV